jgi:hypothetical protein
MYCLLDAVKVAAELALKANTAESQGLNFFPRPGDS